MMLWSRHGRRWVSSGEEGGSEDDEEEIPELR